MVVTKSSDKPDRNRISAIFSQVRDFLKLPRMLIKDKMQLAMNKVVVTTVSSSINVACDNFISFSEVSTIKHSPRRLDEALRIWDDFCLLFSSIEMRRQPSGWLPYMAK